MISKNLKKIYIDVEDDSAYFINEDGTFKRFLIYSDKVKSLIMDLKNKGVKIEYGY